MHQPEALDLISSLTSFCLYDLMYCFFLVSSSARWALPHLLIGLPGLKRVHVIYFCPESSIVYGSELVKK